VTGQPAGLVCPGYSELAYAVIGTTQAVCGNEDCNVIMWDPTRPIQEQPVQEIDLTGWGL